MPHVAEGELHAWLDGALDQLGEKRAEQVREHLRGCAACQQSLAAEEALRARATEVLGLATPRAGEMPPLEALMERAKAAPVPVVATKPGRMSVARRRLAWAASVVIALGAGWMARELGLHGPMASDETAVRTASAPAVSANAGGDEAQVEETTLGDMAAAPRESEAPVESPRVGNAPAVADVGARAALERVATDVAESTAKLEQLASSNVATAPPPMFEPAAPARESVALGAGAAVGAVESSAGPTPRDASPTAPPRAVVGEQSAVAGGVAAGRAADASARPVPGRQERAASATVAQANADVIGIQRARQEGARSDVPDLFVEGRARGAANDQQGRARAPAVTAEADASEATGLIVPGLEVLRVHWTEVVPGQTGLRVLQRLASGDTLEIRFVRSGGAAADAAADPLATILGWESAEGWSQVVLLQRDGWLVARAPIREPELRALLEGIAAGQR